MPSAKIDWTRAVLRITRFWLSFETDQKSFPKVASRLCSNWKANMRCGRKIKRPDLANGKHALCVLQPRKTN